jgi:lysophospholipase L1-like esterase
LLVSTSDKGGSYNGEWKTAIGVEPLVETQYNLANKIGAGFFNLYHAMGGEGTIVNWVQGDTVLARKDYTHPNPKGAKVLAKLIYQSIMDEYNEYEMDISKGN